jgi:POT family proton-dependent oligopeptide transporter
MKMVWGLAILALGYVLIAFSVKGMGMEEKISMFFLIGMYFLHTCGELAISPVGLSVVNKLSPKRFASMMMAVFFLSSVVGNFTAGLFSGLIPQPKVKEIIIDQKATISKSELLESTAFLLNKSENPMEAAVISAYEEDLDKAGKKFDREKMVNADTLYKVEATMIKGDLEGGKSLIFADRTNFSSFKDVTANNELTKKYNTNKDVIIRNISIDNQHVGSIVFENSENSLFGFKINTLYAFFIIFIIMSGATSLLLFVLHKRVEKLMHGIR